MFNPENEVHLRAQAYARSFLPPLTLIQQLGFGQDGTVWSSSRNTAIKCFEREENYNRELVCYQRLQLHEVQEISGFAVPSLVANDDSLMVVEISIVFPPFLIDFGKSYLDQPPDFDEMTMQEFWKTREELFSTDQWRQVRSAIDKLRSFGIFYLDAKPANIRFGRQ